LVPLIRFPEWFVLGNPFVGVDLKFFPTKKSQKGVKFAQTEVLCSPAGGGIQMPSENDGWPPERCDMPDLSHLNAMMSLNFLLNRVFGGGGSSDAKSYAFAMNFVRIVDILLLDYEKVRIELVRYINSPNHVISPLLIATGSCEALIGTALRAIKIARRMRSDRNAPANAPVIQRRISVLADSIADRIGGMRDAIQHIDGQIAGNTWSPGDAVCLFLKNDRMELAGQHILYSEMADWVLQLHALSNQVACYRPPKTVLQ
jgi:hypothetical protein